MCTPSGYIYKIDTVHVIFTDARDENHDSDDTETLASPSLASPAPSLEGGRVWCTSCTRVVLFPRIPGEHEYS